MECDTPVEELSQDLSDHTLPSEEATFIVAKQKNRRYKTRSMHCEKKESAGRRKRGGYVEKLAERYATSRERVFTSPTRREGLRSSLPEGRKEINSDILRLTSEQNVPINTSEEEETIISAVKDGNDSSSEHIIEECREIASKSEKEVEYDIQISPGNDIMVSIDMQLLGLEGRNGKLIKSSVGTSPNSVNLAVSDEVKGKEDGRRESVIGPENTRPEGLDGSKKFGRMSLLGSTESGKLHSVAQEVTLLSTSLQCTEANFIRPDEAVTHTDRSVHLEPKPISSWLAPKVDIPQTAVFARDRQHPGSSKPLTRRGFSVSGSSDASIASSQLHPQSLSTPVAALEMFSPQRTAKRFPSIDCGEMSRCAVVSESRAIDDLSLTTRAGAEAAATDVHTNVDSTYFGSQVLGNRGGQAASIQLPCQVQQHLQFQPPPIHSIPPPELKLPQLSPIVPSGPMPPFCHLLQGRTESTPRAVLHAPGVLSSPSTCPPSSGSIPLPFTSLPESASVGAVLSGNEHAKFADLVSDIISLLDDVPNKTACSTAVGQTGSEQGVVNLAGEPGPEADHLLGREQGTSDICEEQRKMSMGSDLHGKNHSIDADDVSGLKFEGCSSSVRPMKETQSIPVCLDEVERANTDGVKTAFPPAVSEPEQVKPVEVVGEGGVTMAAEEGGKGSEGLDHLSMVEEVDVVLASPLVCEGSVDMEEDVEWGGSGGDLRLHKERCLVEGEKAGVSGDIGGKARAAEGVNEECACVEKVEDENVSVDKGDKKIDEEKPKVRKSKRVWSTCSPKTLRSSSKAAGHHSEGKPTTSPPKQLFPLVDETPTSVQTEVKVLPAESCALLGSTTAAAVVESKQTIAELKTTIMVEPKTSIAEPKTSVDEPTALKTIQTEKLVPVFPKTNQNSTVTIPDSAAMSMRNDNHGRRLRSRSVEGKESKVMLPAKKPRMDKKGTKPRNCMKKIESGESVLRNLTVCKVTIGNTVEEKGGLGIEEVKLDEEKKGEEGEEKEGRNEGERKEEVKGEKMEEKYAGEREKEKVEVERLEGKKVEGKLKEKVGLIKTSRKDEGVIGKVEEVGELAKENKHLGGLHTSDIKSSKGDAAVGVCVEGVVCDIVTKETEYNPEVKVLEPSAAPANVDQPATRPNDLGDVTPAAVQTNEQQQLEPILPPLPPLLPVRRGKCVVTLLHLYFCVMWRKKI